MRQTPCAAPSLPCLALAARSFADRTEARCDICPMDRERASIVVRSRAGGQFTTNFMSDHVNATNRKAEARLEGDTLIVVIDDSDVYEVPLAAIEGG